MFLFFFFFKKKKLSLKLSLIPFLMLANENPGGAKVIFLVFFSL